MDRRRTVVLTSAGSAYNLDLGFVPNFVHTRNVTQWKQTSQNTDLWWDSTMANASWYGYVTQGTITDGALPNSGTTNGFTPYDTTVRTARQKVISGATQANPVVLTVTGHGWTAAANDGDTVTINFMGDDSMVELNGGRYTMTYVGPNSISIDVDGTGFTAYSAATRGGIIMNNSDEWDDTGFKGITLGTVPMANNADVILVEAAWYDIFSEVSA